MTLLEKRAIKITELSERLDEANKIIAEFVWPGDATKDQRRQFAKKAAKFCGCTIPQFLDTQETETINQG